MYFEPEIDVTGPVIKVIGIGGGGGNAVSHMVKHHIEGVEFFVINTDAQALKFIDVGHVLQIGTSITKGLGAGANPDVGRRAAEEDRENIKNFLTGAEMVFIAAGMGGGTGTGAAPVVAEIAQELGILTVAVVTKPFAFEGKKRKTFADEGTKTLAEHVHSLITIPNDKLLKVLGRGVKMREAFEKANDVLLDSVQGIVELITKPGIINVDFSDVKTVMSEMGMAMMGVGRASGDSRAKDAVDLAFSSPLLEDVDLSGAKGVLVNVTSGKDELLLDEFDEIGNFVKQYLSADEAIVIIGSSEDETSTDEIKVTVVIAGIDRKASITDNVISNSNIATSAEINQNSENAISVNDDQAMMKKEKVDEINVTIPAFLRPKS